MGLHKLVHNYELFGGHEYIGQRGIGVGTVLILVILGQGTGSGFAWCNAHWTRWRSPCTGWLWCRLGCLERDHPWLDQLETIEITSIINMWLHKISFKSSLNFLNFDLHFLQQWASHRSEIGWRWATFILLRCSTHRCGNWNVAYPWKSPQAWGNEVTRNQFKYLLSNWILWPYNIGDG